MRSQPPRRRNFWMLGWLVLAGSAIGVFALGLLASSINDKRAERIDARATFMQPIADWEADNSKWGVNFPRQYNSWESTKQMNENTAYGGSGYRDHLEDSPFRVLMWAGYPFAKGYNAPRGHYFSVKDVLETERISEKSPASCWTCKSPDVPRVMQRDGVKEYYANSFDHYRDDVKNPIGCADCHDNKTMALRISRPALVDALARQGKDVTKASQQEMRSLVCAQCHVEYYFNAADGGAVTFPWDKGLTAENFETYYDESPHRDWTHAISGAKMIKMQHPDYEIYAQGTHAFRGVSCADCHMPYKSEGGIKFTDHQIRSPLYNVEASCQVCHRWSEKEIWDRVTSIQDKTKDLMNRAEKTITSGHLEIGAAMKRGAADAELERPRTLIAKAQMYWDYVSAANGMGFHAPQESARLLGKAIDLAQDSRLETTRVLARRGGLDPVQVPDVSTVEKAQEYIKPFVTAQTAALEAAKAKRAAEAEKEQPGAAPPAQYQRDGNTGTTGTGQGAR
ncbi:MAG TPA: ammonia-forming cytochrome c nitrite reductase subunit c552 [Deinococcales bacterium]|nr:ammonia-forming cytochrome c nitrite reductase subunit c552 [Deinococcales bacterium]